MANFDTFRADYQLAPASATTKLTGQLGKGAAGDILERIVIIPLAVSAGNVSIVDGNGTAMQVFATGTLVDLKPHVIKLGLRSIIGAWSVTTGASVQVLASGRFQ